MASDRFHPHSRRYYFLILTHPRHWNLGVWMDVVENHNRRKTWSEGSTGIYYWEAIPLDYMKNVG